MPSTEFDTRLNRIEDIVDANTEKLKPTSLRHTTSLDLKINDRSSGTSAARWPRD